MGVSSRETLELLDKALEEVGHTLEGSSVCDLGNQRAWALLKLPIPLTRKGYLMKDYYQKIKKANRHVSIDLNAREGSLQLDLNKDISIEKSKGPFDLITNFGTSEHVSDQYMCFKNIHRLTRLNGLMYHIVPRIGNWTGHCPYYYDVDFFESLAKANGYKIIVAKFWNQDPSSPPRNREECVALFQKISDTEFVSENEFKKFPITFISNPEKTGDYCNNPKGGF